MKLAGNYTLDDLVRTFQGNFNCTNVTRNSHGKPLASELQHIRLELFFVRLEIYSDKVIIYKTETTNGTEKLTRICTLPVAN